MVNENTIACKMKEKQPGITQVEAADARPRLVDSPGHGSPALSSSLESNSLHLFFSSAMPDAYHGHRTPGDRFTSEIHGDHG